MLARFARRHRAALVWAGLLTYCLVFWGLAIGVALSWFGGGQ